MEPRRAIFLDRDNTLNVDRDGYVGDWKKIELFPEVIPVLRAMRSASYLLFLVTNQSGVGRGYFSLEDVDKCNRRLLELIGDGHIFAEICVSTGTPERPDPRRKPSPKFPLEMCAKFSLHPGRCWVIGDGPCDMEMAERAGMRGLYLVREQKKKVCPPACDGDRPMEGKCPSFQDLADAWNHIKIMELSTGKNAPDAGLACLPEESPADGQENGIGGPGSKNRRQTATGAENLTKIGKDIEAKN